MSERIRGVLRSTVMGPLLALALVAAVVAVTTDPFLSAGNLRNIALQVTIVAVVAIGATMVILSAQIDLSSGSLAALSSVLLAGLIQNEGLPDMVAILLIVALGALLGLVNGFFSNYGRIPSFIFTLGTLAIFRGLSFLYTGGTPIFNVSPNLTPLFYERFLGLPLPLIYVMILYSAAWVYLTYTKGGRQIYAVGGNESAARLSGINVNRVRTRAFVIAGAMAATGGILLTARLNSGSPNYGQGLELMAIASAVIGGTSLFGGTGNVLASLLGALTIVVVQNGLNLHGVPAAWQQIALGIIIAAAVGVDMWRSDIAAAAKRAWGRSRSSVEQPRAAKPGEETVGS
ncbi:MAG: ABC transporter permease [Actinomycetota bacterium]|nr:ABC transporter permease [Actinomycetota bacterium]